MTFRLTFVRVVLIALVFVTGWIQYGRRVMDDYFRKPQGDPLIVLDRTIETNAPERIGRQIANGTNYDISIAKVYDVTKWGTKADGVFQTRGVLRSTVTNRVNVGPIASALAQANLGAIGNQVAMYGYANLHWSSVQITNVMTSYKTSSPAIRDAIVNAETFRIIRNGQTNTMDEILARLDSPAPPAPRYLGTNLHHPSFADRESRLSPKPSRPAAELWKTITQTDAQ